MDASDHTKDITGEIDIPAFRDRIGSSVDDWLNFGLLSEYAESPPARDCSTEYSTLYNSGEKVDDRNNFRSLYQTPVTSAYQHLTYAPSFREIVSTLNHRYPIRERDESKIFGSVWVDVDDSGDYDPNATKPKTERPKRGMQATIRDYGETDVDNEVDNEGLEVKHFRPKTSTYEQGRRTGRSMMVTLRFSPERREQFRALANAYPSGTEDENDGLDNQDFDLSLGVRTRGQFRSADDIQNLTTDIDSRYEHLVGHPEARGCSECYDLGLECSLVCNGLDYPCTTCKEDDTKCTLITPQERKGGCRRCIKQKIECSYDRDGGIYAGACDRCVRENKGCIAGPAKLFHTDIRQNFECKNFRKHKTRCLNSSAGSCSNCLKDGIVSPFEAVSKPKNNGKTQRKQPCKRSLRATNNCERSPTSKKQQPLLEVGLADMYLPSGRLEAAPLYHNRARYRRSNHRVVEKTILTSYCHPIKFNWVPPTPPTSAPYPRESLMPCHFCIDPGISYGLCGLGERSVRVVDRFDSYLKGYEERGEGWCSDREENSRMCLPCTMERLLIMSCTEHKIRPIDGLNPSAFDFDKPYRQILEKLGSRRVIPNGTIVDEGIGKQNAYETAWCSICIAPAFFKCCVCPSFNKFGDPTMPGDDYGCGLFLCEICASRLKGSPGTGQKAEDAGTSTSGIDACSINAEGKVFKAAISLDKLIAAALNDSIHYEVGLRADVGFLLHDGELRRFVDAEDRDKGISNCSEEFSYPYSTPEAPKSSKQIR